MRIKGYEVFKYRGHQVDGTEIGYLRGAKFSHFLGVFLRQARLSDFFFVQVGAHNGISNDYLHDFIAKFELQGILVEPQPHIFVELSHNYRNCPTVKLENVAIADEDGQKTFYTIKPELGFLQYANQVASLNREHTRRMIDRHLAHEASPEVVKEFKTRKLTLDGCIETLTVRSSTFPSLLARHCVSRYDLLQIDAEGFDYEVLKASEIGRYRPSFINYEHEHLSERDRQDSWRLLKGLGYHLFTHGHAAGDTAAYLLD
jgi:FkbM family methyltransferase